MGHLITQACRENQANAADLYRSAREWAAVATKHGSEIVQSAAGDFATRDQLDAARLSRADRLLRGLEA